MSTSTYDMLLRRQRTDPKERQKQLKSAAITLCISAAVLALVLIIRFYEPNPPLSSGVSGMDIILGNDDAGMNEVYELVAAGERTAKAEIEQEIPAPQVQTAPAEQAIETDNTPDPVTPAVVHAQPKPTPTATPSDKTPTETKPAEPTEPKPVVNPNALFGGSKGGAGGTGGPNDSKGTGSNPGDQGSRTGNPDGRSFEDGAGDGNQPGYGWDLEGRGLRVKPNKESPKPIAGRLILDLVVDQHGNVIEARRNRNSTIADPQVVEAYIEETKSRVKFDPSPDGKPQTFGTFRYTFQKQ